MIVKGGRLTKMFSAGMYFRWTSTTVSDMVRLATLHLVIVIVFSSDTTSGAKRYRESDPIVSIDSGRVRGKRVYVPSIDKKVDTFLGIPFAKPPVGEMRFRLPVQIEPWSGILNATTQPNSCLQESDGTFGPDFYGSNMWNPPTPVSEDCLYLNVFVPWSENTRLKKSAVMVWIYGGGFYSGTTTLSLYDGKILAAENNLIVVSIGYRLGALGFLSLNDAVAPGNAGLFDQLMGLDWVQHNIRYFGGDPTNVTLFGESAGSVSVSLHLLAPLSRNKFHRAIMQSGTANMPWATTTIDEAKSRSMELAFVYLGCPKTDDVAEVASCLREVPAMTVIEKQWVSRGICQFPFLPVIDGVFLTEAPAVSLRRRNFKKCPIIIGSNANEGSFFVIYELKDLIQLDGKTMTRAQYESSMESLFYYYPQYPAELSESAKTEVKFHYRNALDPDDSDKNVHQIDMAVADSQFVCPLNHFAHSYALAGQHVYMYFFSQRYNSNPWPSWMGVLHGDEIFFMFGEILKFRNNFTEDERQLSRKMMFYWTNFAKTGNPNVMAGTSVSAEEWPEHTPQGREYLELNSRYIGLSDKWKAVGRGPRSKECDFWLDHLPKLINTTGPPKNSRLVPETTHQHCAEANSSATTPDWRAHSWTLLLLTLIWILGLTGSRCTLTGSQCTINLSM